MIALLFLAVAVALRSARFDDPLFGLDEQFYAVVGRRLMGGGTLYVDAFDRKPAGLFALFAALAALPGDPLFIAKIAATGAAAIGALLVALLAARAVPRPAAVLAGIWYLVLVGALGGSVAQAPVFYNPLVAAAALLVLGTAPGLTAMIDRRRAVGAMLLVGVAIQLKTTAVFEGAAIGGWLVIRLCKARGALAIRPAALLVGAAALPTLGVAAGFMLAGLGHSWWFATMEAQGLKTGALGAASVARLPALVAGIIAPVLLAAAGTYRSRWDERLTLLLSWVAATIVEMVAIGQFHLHYALPLVVPAAVLAAPFFAMRIIGPLALAVIAALPVWSQIVDARAEAAIGRRAHERVVARLPIDLKSTCLLVYGAPMSYYLDRQACVATPYLYIDQLDAEPEAHALPIDATVALAAALARRPGTILTVAHPGWTERNRRNDALIAVALARYYHLVASVPHGWGSADPTPLNIWRRSTP